MTAIVTRLHPEMAPALPPNLVAEADHRIGNNLALIGAMLRLQSNEVGRRAAAIPVREVKNLLAETAARIEAVGRLHRRLAAAGDGAVIDVGDYLRDIVSSIVESLTAQSATRLVFDLRSSCALHANQIMPLGLIAGEIVSNALKYAHPTGIPTALTVDCASDGKSLRITIADDGVGLPEGFDPASSGGLGFRLIRSLVEQLGAKSTFDSGPLGLRFILSMPI